MRRVKKIEWWIYWERERDARFLSIQKSNFLTTENNPENSDSVTKYYCKEPYGDI